MPKEFTGELQIVDGDIVPEQLWTEKCGSEISVGAHFGGNKGKGGNIKGSHSYAAVTPDATNQLKEAAREERAADKVDDRMT